MATIRELEEGGAAPSVAIVKKRKTSANEETKRELLERRMMGADVVTMDLTGLFDDEEEDTFAEFRLALSTQFVSDEAAAAASSPSSTAVCVNAKRRLRVSFKIRHVRFLCTHHQKRLTSGLL
ncbi:hypothetical protein R5R35_003218 [Gryllus longicercus]|uniref:Uncharacterized protein n=1 Tax=Gryllus longicercus TaxID=2509291 RepID=A0AAN9VP30_9ORTH